MPIVELIFSPHFLSGLLVGAVGAGAALFWRRRASREPISLCGARPNENSQCNLLHALLDAIPLPIFYKDMQGVYQGCNEAFASFIGYPRKEIVGHTVYDIAPKELADVYHAADLSLARQMGIQVYESEVMHADGSRNQVVFHKSGFQLPDGSPGGLIGLIVDVTEHRLAEEQARYLSHFDPLTGLPNQILFTDRLIQAIAHANRLGTGLAVCCLDLDNFKKVNNAYGHDQGDQLLRRVGERLRLCLREDDTVARFGGDRYSLLLPTVNSQESASAVMQKIQEVLLTPFEIGEHEVVLTACIGIALYPLDGDEATDLIRHADITLQRAKEEDQGVYRFFDPKMNLKVRDQMLMEVHLRQALEREEFVLHYQPQFDTKSGKLVGAEALVRWQHPGDGLISPDRFIPLAEQTGLIIPLGEWVIRTACRQARAWQDMGLPPLRIAVNLSPRQFQQPALYRTVRDILAETGLPPGTLSMEVTESTVMRDVDYAIEMLLRFKELGIHLAIDDFGTGYSSLSYLKRFPVDLLKIDRSFIMEIPEMGDDMAIVTAVIAMAHNLEIKVLAEGVQTEIQREFLHSQRCDELQGFLFSPPLPSEEFWQLAAAPTAGHA